MADIDRGDMRSAALQQHLREAAGGGPDIETVMTGRIEPEMVKRRGKLQCGARDIILRRVVDLDDDMLAEQRAGFRHHLTADPDGAALHGVAGARAAGKEAEGDEKLVEALGVLI